MKVLNMKNSIGKVIGIGTEAVSTTFLSDKTTLLKRFIN